MEGVWIKPEPVDAEYPVILDVKSEVGAGVEENAPSAILEPENLDIKSEITLGEYEFSAGNALTESKKEVKLKKNFKCEECGRFLLSRSHLVIHQRIHTGEKPFQCDICESKFATKRCVTKHMFRHTGEVRQRPIHCPVCDKNFMDKKGLKGHMLQHTNRSRYSCEFCDMTFYLITTLKVHLRTHTGEKPFVCDDCGKGFTAKGSLLRHNRVHSLSCDKCEQTFVQYADLKSHRLTHITPQTSDSGNNGWKDGFEEFSEEALVATKIPCDKSDTRDEVVNTHTMEQQITGTGVRPFICDECGLRFAQKGHILLHLRRHLNLKRYFCDH
ncbi:Zinc finger protein [Pseudolycoriella hygida]|uniref:Zinc finger protein n=1 Tax=Pseudolycoriella hygida TaxID=35572 RepID=A0A9Q0S305_9DIPT|nr:Zinc finger protein [Pseudolycoriella hygida]